GASHPAADAAPAAPAGATPAALQAMTRLRGSLDKLEGTLKGTPESMRGAVLASMQTGQPLPPQLQPLANLAAQTGQQLLQPLGARPADQRANVLQLVNLTDGYPLSPQLLNGMPLGAVNGAGPTQAPPVPGAIGQAVSAMGGVVDNPNKLLQLLEAAKRDG